MGDPRKLRTDSLMCSLTTGCIICILSIGFISVAYGTDYWQVVTVDETKLTAVDPDNYLHFSRNRGLFRVCVPSDDTSYFSDPPSDVDIVDSTCIWDSGMYMPAERDWGDRNNIREHLVRVDLALFALALFLLLLSLIMCGFACWDVSTRFMLGAGLCTLFAAFCAIAGMAVFHGVMQIETNELDSISMNCIFAACWDGAGNLGAASSWTYGWSYALGWVGCALALITSFIFISKGFNVRNKKHEHQRKLQPLALPEGPGPQMVMMGGPQGMMPNYPVKVVRVPVPQPYPVPVPMMQSGEGMYGTLPMPSRPMIMPQQRALPMLGYPTMNGGTSARSVRSEAYNGAVYQTQPPAYPDGPNFNVANSVF